MKRMGRSGNACARADCGRATTAAGGQEDAGVSCFLPFCPTCHGMRRLDKATGDESSGAGRSRAGGEQRRCGGDRLAGFPARRMALLRQPARRVRRRRRQGSKLRAAAGDGGQPRAVDELRRRPRGAPRKYLARAKALATSANAREQAWLATTAAWIDGDTDRCLKIHEDMAAEWPRDLLAGKLGQLHAFNCGDAETLLRIGERLFAANQDNRYVQGMYAFGLEECNRLDEAETVARAALGDRPPRSVGASRHRPLPGGARQDAGGRGLPGSRCPTPGRAATPSCTPTTGGISRCS